MTKLMREATLTPAGAKAIAILASEGWRIRHEGSCLIVSPPSRACTGTYVSLYSLEESPDPEGYIRQAVSEASARTVPVLRSVSCLDIKPGVRS